MPPAAATRSRPPGSRVLAGRARRPGRRWTALAGLLVVVGLLAPAGMQPAAAAGPPAPAGLPLASAGSASQLRWVGRSDGRAEDRWTADAAVRPWAGSGGEPVAYRDGAHVRFDDEAAGRRVVVADLQGVRPASVRFAHRHGRYLLDSIGERGVAGPTGLVKDAGGELELRGANAYRGATDLRAGLLSLGHDRALGGSTLLLRGGAVAAAASPRTIDNRVRFLPAGPAGPVTVTVAGDQDLSFTGDVELNRGQPTLLEITSTATTRLLGQLRDAADEPGTLAQRSPAPRPDVPGTLVKLGPGRLELAGVATYSGGTVVADGTLVAAAATPSGAGPATLPAPNAGTASATGSSATRSGTRPAPSAGTASATGGPAPGAGTTA
jgi:autotransporter-associated beta strand protein